MSLAVTCELLTETGAAHLSELLQLSRHCKCQQEGVLVTMHMLVDPLMVGVEQPQVFQHLYTPNQAVSVSA